MTQLADWIPAAIVADCSVATTRPPTAAVAEYRCSPETLPGIAVEYWLFDRAAPMNRAMDKMVDTARKGVRPCVEGRTNRAEGYRTTELGPVVGDEVCLIDPDGNAVMIWSHRAHRILARAELSIPEGVDPVVLWRERTLWPCDTPGCR